MRSGQGGQDPAGGAGLPAEPTQGRGPRATTRDWWTQSGAWPRGARLDCARKRLAPPWCAIGERGRGVELGVVRVHAQVTYLGATSEIGVCAMAFSLLLRGGRIRTLKVKGDPARPTRPIP